MRFGNDETPRIIRDIGLQLGPFQEFDWPGWDRKVHGSPPTGCTLLDPEPEDGPGPQDDGGDPPASDPASNASGSAQSAGADPAKPTRAAAKPKTTTSPDGGGTDQAASNTPTASAGTTPTPATADAASSQEPPR